MKAARRLPATQSGFLKAVDLQSALATTGYLDGASFVVIRWNSEMVNLISRFPSLVR